MSPRKRPNVEANWPTPDEIAERTAAIRASTVAGIHYQLPPKGTLATDDLGETAGVPDKLAPGWYAVSVNYLYGYPTTLFRENGAQWSAFRPYYSYFRRFRPIATAGYSIYIYHLAESDIAAARGT